MPSTEKKDKRKSWVRKLRNKYRLVIMNADTYEEKFSFRLSRLNVMIVAGTTVILLIILTIFVIAFTPLREYIPGYTNLELQRHVHELRQKADSLEREFELKNLYLNNIKKILHGEEILSDSSDMSKEPGVNIDEIVYNRSEEDSILRMEYEREAEYALYYNENDELYTSSPALNNPLFFTPLNGIITNPFNLVEKHFGVDIVARENEVVKATLDGTVVFSDWSVGTGYVLAVQHQGNFLSVYKHNSVLLKDEGSLVKAGEAVAIVGNSGELSSGLHLHFELWYNGAPVNPEEYIAF